VRAPGCSQLPQDFLHACPVQMPLSRRASYNGVGRKGEPARRGLCCCARVAARTCRRAVLALLWLHRSSAYRAAAFQLQSILLRLHLHGRHTHPRHPLCAPTHTFPTTHARSPMPSPRGWRLADPHEEAFDHPGAPRISGLPHLGTPNAGGGPLFDAAVPSPSPSPPPLPSPGILSLRPLGSGVGADGGAASGSAVAAMRRAWGMGPRRGDAALQDQGGGDLDAQLVSRTLSGTQLHGRHFMTVHHNPLHHGGPGRPPLPGSGWRGGAPAGGSGGATGGGAGSFTAGGGGGSVAGEAGAVPSHGVSVRALHIGTFVYKGCTEPVEMVWVTAAALEGRATGLAGDEAALDKGGPKGRRIEVTSGVADGAVAPLPDVLDGLRDGFLLAAGAGEEATVYAQWLGQEMTRRRLFVGDSSAPLAGGRGRSFTTGGRSALRGTAR
jgi:hypothetical protein